MFNLYMQSLYDNPYIKRVLAVKNCLHLPEPIKINESVKNTCNIFKSNIFLTNFFEQCITEYFLYGEIAIIFHKQELILKNPIEYNLQKKKIIYKSDDDKYWSSKKFSIISNNPKGRGQGVLYPALKLVNSLEQIEKLEELRDRETSKILVMQKSSNTLNKISNQNNDQNKDQIKEKTTGTLTSIIVPNSESIEFKSVDRAAAERRKQMKLKELALLFNEDYFLCFGDGSGLVERLYKTYYDTNRNSKHMFNQWLLNKILDFSFLCYNDDNLSNHNNFVLPNLPRQNEMIYARTQLLKQKLQ